MVYKTVGLSIQLHGRKAATVEHVGKAMLHSPWLPHITREMQAQTLV